MSNSQGKIYNDSRITQGTFQNELPKVSAKSENSQHKKKEFRIEA